MTHADRLRELVTSNEWMMDVLLTARVVMPPEWAVTSGVIRNLVWDDLHGFPDPTPVKDVDVAFFDASDNSRERDAELERLLADRSPTVPWEVTNQAGVHIWYEAKFGHQISPIVSLTDGIARYPETATSVGIRLEADGSVTLIAPCGLDDLFGLVLRRNTRQVTREYFLERARAKRIAELWPKVTVIED